MLSAESVNIRFIMSAYPNLFFSLQFFPIHKSILSKFLQFLLTGGTIEYFFYNEERNVSLHEL